MITEDYVSFETAKLLKEKGFNENTPVNYFVGDDKHRSCVVGEMIYHKRFKEDTHLIAAPTLQMAMKWLREVHNLFIEIQYATALFFEPHTTIYFKIYYMSLDYNTSGKDMLPDDYIREYYASYEEACESAIKYCLEDLI